MPSHALFLPMWAMMGIRPIFFGLSERGKEPPCLRFRKGKLIGEMNEHGWTKENTVFNLREAAMPRSLNLSEENETENLRGP